MFTIQKRLAEIFPLVLPRGTMAQIAKACNVSRPTVSNWFNNPEKVNSISRTHAEIICREFRLDVAPLWLSEGVGQKFLTEKAIGHANVSPGPDMRGLVPLISWVQAGAWCESEAVLLPEEAERWFDCPVSHSTSTYALRVRGDSMTAPHGNSRTYPEGCFILVDAEKRSPNNGDRVIACLEGSEEVTFKVYKNEDGRQWLHPLNPAHEQIRDNFKVVGTVLGKWEDG